MGGPVSVEPFAIDVAVEDLADLRTRIRHTRWPQDPPTTGWSQGADPAYLRSLLSTWADDFDWRKQERELNHLSHYRAHVGGRRIHFIHEPGKGPDPVPLILTHGFPSTFIEHLQLLPMLTDPAAHGGTPDDAFDVVITSLPGYAYSDPPAGPWLESGVADDWSLLMRDVLGYERFGAHGSDIGSGVTIELGRRHPDRLIGMHLSAFYLDPPPRPWPQPVAEFIEDSRRERTGDVAYSRVQSTRPQTAAYGLADSPAGLAAWIVDVFRAFSDCGGDVESRFTRDQILTNLTIYWTTRTIASSMQPYYDYEHHEAGLPANGRIEVPAGFAVFADSHRPGSARPPRELAEGAFDVVRWTDMPRGGHFAAMEEPELLAEDIRAFFRPLRDA